MQDNSSKDGLDLPVDKGWEQMKLQLDEAMPQRRRRFFWWWFPLLLLVGFVVSYAWSQLDFTLPAEEGDRQERLEAKQSEPVATDLDVSQLGEETVVESQGEQSGVEAGLPSQENPVAIAPAEASQSQYEPKLLLEAEENQMVQITEAETGSVETLTNKKKPPTLSVIADNEMDKDINVDVPYEETVSQKTRPLYELEPLSSMPIKELLQPTPGMALAAVTSVPIRKFRWYVEGLAGTALNDSYSSTLLGIGVERSLGKTWRLSTGVQYQYSRSSWFSNQSEPVLLMDETESTFFNGASYDISAAYQNLQTHRGNAYLDATYRIRPRLDVSLGMQSSYFAKASAQISGEDAFGPQPNTEFDNAGLRVDLYDDQIAAVSHDEISAGAPRTVPLDLKRWQWSVRSAVSYRWHPAWSVQLQYVRNLTPWPAQGEVFGGPDNINVGLRYYFRK